MSHNHYLIFSNQKVDTFCSWTFQAASEGEETFLWDPLGSLGRRVLLGRCVSWCLFPCPLGSRGIEPFTLPSLPL